MRCSDVLGLRRLFKRVANYLSFLVVGACVIQMFSRLGIVWHLFVKRWLANLALSVPTRLHHVCHSCHHDLFAPRSSLSLLIKYFLGNLLASIES